MAKEKQKTGSIYNSWSNMKQRCDNRNNHKFHLYGGRGIKYTTKWKNFDDFYEDMGTSFIVGTSLDRIDVNGNYCKENCRWATQKEQQNNRRNNKRFYFNGKNLTLNEWSSINGIKRSTLAQRIYVYKWNLQKALTICT